MAEAEKSRFAQNDMILSDAWKPTTKYIKHDSNQCYCIVFIRYVDKVLMDYKPYALGKCEDIYGVSHCEIHKESGCYCL